MVRLVTKDPIGNRAQKTFVTSDDNKFTLTEQGVEMDMGDHVVLVPWSNVCWLEKSKAPEAACDVCGLPWDHTHEVSPPEMAPAAPEEPACGICDKPGPHDHPVTPRKRGRPRKHG